MQGPNVLLASFDQLSKSPMTLIKERSIFSFSSEDFLNPKTATTDIPLTPALRQIDDNTINSVVLSHAFIQNEEPDILTALAVESIVDFQDLGDGCGTEDPGGGVKCKMLADNTPIINMKKTTANPRAVSMTTSSELLSLSTPPQTKQKLNKRDAKALAKKATMTPNQYMKYSQYRGKNNESVARSRNKKRQKLAESEARCDELEADNIALATRITELEAEVKTLMAMLIKNAVPSADA